MSAFLVTATHIDAMLTAALALSSDNDRFTWYKPVGDVDAVEQNELTTANADEVGSMLLTENHRSVCFRYRETAGEGPIDFHHRHLSIGGDRRGRNGRRVPDPVVVLRLVSCYEYQTCEHPEWRGSVAKAFCEGLRLAAIYNLPGYDDAPWAIGGGDVNIFAK